MPVPQYTLGTPGGIMDAVSVPSGSALAAFLDLSADVEGRLTCQMETGATAPTLPTTFTAYPVYGNATTNTLASPVTAGATSISVASKTAIGPNQKIALISASTGLGEIVSITGAITGTGPYTVPVLATVNAYSSGDHVYLIAQTSTYSVNPIPGAIKADWDYSTSLSVETGFWILAINNTDTAEAVTVTVSMDLLTGFD